jgi:sodium/potassium-transporting ATPase subunit alpha
MSPRRGLTTLEREMLKFVTVICSIMFAMIAVVIVVWRVEVEAIFHPWNMLMITVRRI